MSYADISESEVITRLQRKVKLACAESRCGRASYDNHLGRGYTHAGLASLPGTTAPYDKTIKRWREMTSAELRFLLCKKWLPKTPRSALEQLAEEAE